MKRYIPKEIEKKWQDKWDQTGIYDVDLSNSASKKRYVLVEFTYPSGNLHIGHWFTFLAPDIYARYSRMNGYRVFLPNGFDAFGLPAENAAIKNNIHPKDWTYSNIEAMKVQFRTMGESYNWENQVITCDVDYYRWNQWIFIKMLEKGLAYKGKALANWCESCQTVLANENVESGTCWRCHNLVIQKEVEQWFLKITDYADQLIWPENPSVDWPKAVREAQNNWIGKSEGMEIDFPLEDGKKLTVFTVYPETIYGVTYMVVAPEHPLIQDSKSAEVKEYVAKAKAKSELERKSLDKDKTGVFTGIYSINPVNKARIPIWVADYVIFSYGTGAVMGVPGSDHRDYAFAKTYSLDVIRVIGKSANDDSEIKDESGVLEEGYLVNSSQFNGLETPLQAREKVKDFLESEGFGKRKTQYHIHDWSISRQRYWGTPIPIINCSECGPVLVPEADLPVELPYDVDYAPKGMPPLATNEEWMSVKCPKCGEDAKREAETMDTFVDSSWYFFRYIDPKNKQEIFNQDLAQKWLPVDIYFGGAEHTLGHTLYSRFFTKFFKDLGLIQLDEYASRRIQHGIVLGPDGDKMSKSRGNVINPEEEVEKYGSDTVRLYLSFMMPYEATGPWDTERVWGPYRFLQRFWDLMDKVVEDVEPDKRDLILMNQTIKKIGADIEDIKSNTAIASLMEWLNHLSRKDKVSRREYKTFLLLLAPFAPHITEELWERIGESYSIHNQSWPKVDEKYLQDEEIKIAVQVDGKLREILLISSDIMGDSKMVEKMALASEKVAKYLGNLPPKKVIYIPGKVISFVSGSN